MRATLHILRVLIAFKSAFKSLWGSIDVMILVWGSIDVMMKRAELAAAETLKNRAQGLKYFTFSDRHRLRQACQNAIQVWLLASAALLCVCVCVCVRAHARRLEYCFQWRWLCWKTKQRSCQHRSNCWHKFSQGEGNRSI
jgi:hypothetical protein